MLPAVILAAALATSACAQEMLSQANAALQAGEADRALAMLNSLPSTSSGQAEDHNLQCRVRYTLEQWN